MNAFTKVLVVLVLVLSLGFAVSQMVLYGRREDVGQQLTKARQQVKTLTDQRDELQGQLSDAKQRLQNVRSQKNTEIDRLKNETQNLTEQNELVRTRLNTAEASVQQLTETTQAQSQRIDDARAQIDELKTRIADLSGQVEEKIAQVQDLQETIRSKNSNIGDLEHTLAQVKKQRQELTAENKRYQAKLAELVQRGIEIEPAYAPPINGRVVRVDPELRTAVIDRGSEAGVKPNTEFTVYRDGQFVANLIVTDVVDKQASVGRATLLAEGKSVQVGDKATTEIR